MWGITPLHNLSRSTKYEALGRPQKRIIPLDLWKQRELVRPVEVPQGLYTDQLYLGDFGLAIKLGDPMTHDYPPTKFCSPARFHRKYNYPSFACGMWSYMVIFAELYHAYTPFPTWFEGGIITGITRCLGPLPEQ